MRLIDLPLEILEHILFYINSTNDLLHLALTRRQFSQIVIPVHLELRKIRCLTNSSELWDNLAKRPDFCVRVRELELYEQHTYPSHRPRHPIVPKFHLDADLDIAILWPYRSITWRRSEETNGLLHVIKSSLGSLRTKIMLLRLPRSSRTEAGITRSFRTGPCSNEQSICSLCSVLPLLKHLRRFSLTDCRYIGADMLSTTLETVVHSSRSLREVAVTWSTTEPIGFDPFLPLWGLSDLTSFTLNVNHLQSDLMYLDQLIHMLVDGCKDLEELFLNIYITVEGVNLSRIWEAANWKYLKHLSLGRGITIEDVEAGHCLCFQRFLETHPQIECLENHSYFSYTLFGLVDLSVLRNLRALRLLSLTKHHTAAKTAHAIKNVECLQLGNSFFERELYIPSLRILVIRNTLYYRAALPEIFPATLERLCIQVYLDSRMKSEEQVNVFLGRLLTRASPLRGLTHLCISTQPPYILEFQSQKCLRRLASLSSLRYFGIADYYGYRAESWIRFKRDQTGKYLGFESDDTVAEVRKWWKFSSFE